jgi:hypothetical protein
VHGILVPSYLLERSDEHNQTCTLQLKSCTWAELVWLTRLLVQVFSQTSQKTQAPHKVPYIGYRADLLAVIGNLAHAHRASQDAIAKDGGLELILGQTHFSPSEPVVREWALWAVRNLCTGNVEIQERVRNLKLQTTVQDDALAQRNQHVELDELTGKLKLVDLGG